MNRKSKAASTYRRTWLAGLAVALALAGAAASASGQRSAALEIENFGKVNDNYFRGGQPKAEHYGELRRLGIKTVIDLRKDSKREAAEWARAAEAVRLRLLRAARLVERPGPRQLKPRQVTGDE
ncbi:MAG TPA: hypothetical protein VK421_00840 [Pyrinomonadaceae bacterium]|nr:hypothetical protein [Pyrinomonadaceae bacterium]